MAFNLSKAGAKELSGIVDKLREKRSDLDHISVSVQETVRVVVDALNDAVGEYNSALADARSFVEGIASALRDEYDGKSERWQEGETGQAASALIEAWENIDLTDVDPVEVEVPGVESDSHADDIEALPTAPE